MTPNGDMALGALVKRRRRELGLEQREVAALAGVSRKFLSDLERGKSTVQMDRVLAVLGALGLKLSVGISDGVELPRE